MASATVKVGALVTVFALATVGSCAYERGTVGEAEFTVTGRDTYTRTTCYEDSGCSTTTHRQVSTNGGNAGRETFNVVNSLWHWRWDSERRYGVLQECESYRVRTFGWNLGIDGWNRAIIDVEHIPLSEVQQNSDLMSRFPERCARQTGIETPEWARRNPVLTPNS